MIYLISAALAAFASLLSTQNYNQATKLLTRNSTAGLGINAAQTITEDVTVSGSSTLTVMVDMTGGAIGDLTVELWPFEADNLTTMPVVLPPVRSIGPIFSTRVYYEAEWDVSALEKVQVRIRNNNVGAQTLTRYSWRTQ